VQPGLDARFGPSPFVYAPPERLGEVGQSEFIPGRSAAGAGTQRQTMRETRHPGVAPPALVPYEDVFSHYRDAASRTLERERIPARLRQYVKLYFEQLEPQ
jgi:hypothetical protein